MERTKTIKISIPEKQRIDIYLKNALSISRGMAQKMIKNGNVFLNKRIVRLYHTKVKQGDILEYIENVPEPQVIKEADIPLNIIYEDDYLFAINKQPGLVVHPAPGHMDDTLVNAIIGKKIKRENFLNEVTRLGIVHRLDKDTSGAMVIAKDEKTRVLLSEMFKRKEIIKKYNCLVYGVIDQAGKIQTRIERDARHRKKFTAKTLYGKDAETVFRPIEKFFNVTLLELNLITGRTHQIRVHMNYLKHEVLGDPLYGDRNKDIEVVEFLGYDKMSVDDLIPRQMLHSREIEFFHPILEKRIKITADLPPDFARLLDMLRKKQEKLK
ncbi:MAG: RluA family pseudouridine synthase [Candidatus Goldbacteria bacterium]|nr:RluA family pseudouridine synthase [Candidatus Goldiibacteriota bacterium]